MGVGSILHDMLQFGTCTLPVIDARVSFSVRQYSSSSGPSQPHDDSLSEVAPYGSTTKSG